MSCQKAPPFNFGPRSFTNKIEFQNKEDAFHVSAIGPSLFIVPVGDVTPSTSSDEIRRSCIQVFRKGIGINIKGVSKFMDSDHVIVFSSRYLAVVHADEIKGVVNGEDEVQYLCEKRIIEVPNDRKIISVKCLEKKWLLIIFDRVITKCSLKQDGHGQFSVNLISQPSKAWRIDVLTSEEIRSEFTTRACCFMDEDYTSCPDSVLDQFKMFLGGENGICLIYDGESNTTKAIEAGPHTKDVNMASLMGPLHDRRVVVINDTHISSFPVNGSGARVTTRIGSHHSNKFAVGTTCGGILSFKKGTIVSHKRKEGSIAARCFLADMLCSGELSYCNKEEDTDRAIFCSFDSAWEYVNLTLLNEKMYRHGTLSLLNDSPSRIFVSGDYIYLINEDSVLEAYVFTDGKLVVHKSWGKLLSDGTKLTDIRVTDTRVKNARIYLITQRGILFIDPLIDNKKPKEFCCVDIVWLTPIGRDVLTISRSGKLSLIDTSTSSIRISADSSTFIGTKPTMKELNENFIVRRLSSGKLFGLIIGYKNKLMHLMYTDTITKDGEPVLGTLHQKSIHHMNGTQDVEISRFSKADSVHIAEMLLESGGLLSILLRNGTIVQYKVTLDKVHGVSFHFISSRRTDVIGLHLIRSPKGLRIVGFVNNYECENFRTCDDDMVQIKAIAKTFPRSALVDPYSSTVECTLPKWNPDHLKSVFLPDFDSGIMNTVVVRTEKNVEVNAKWFSYPISPPVSLTKIRRPPGTFKGVASVKVDERYHLVAMSFLNTHVYILDTVTGSFDERAVFGWENEISAPTLTEVNNGHCMMMTHTRKLFTLIDLELKKNGEDNYDIHLTPLTRTILPKKLIEKYSKLSFSCFRGEHMVPAVDYSTTPKKEGMGSSVVQINCKKKENMVEEFIRVTPVVSNTKKAQKADIQFTHLMQLDSSTNREFLQIPTEPGMIVVEESDNGVVFKHGRYVKEERLSLPIRCFSTMVFTQMYRSGKDWLLIPVNERIVWNAVVDGEHRVCLYSMNIRKDGRVERHRIPTYLPFSKTTSPVKLFIYMETCDDFIMDVYVYRLIEGSNYLEVIRVACRAIQDTTESIANMEKPRIFLERDAVEDLESFDVHIVNSDFLITNDGPRMIRVCECSKVIDESVIGQVEEMLMASKCRKHDLKRIIEGK